MADEQQGAILTLPEISRRCASVAEGLPIKALYLFGSYARGTARPDSDVDLACEFEDGYRPGISFLRWDEAFSRSLGKRVDLLVADAIKGSCSEYLRESFSDQAVKVYARG